MAANTTVHSFNKALAEYTNQLTSDYQNAMKTMIQYKSSGSKRLSYDTKLIELEVNYKKARINLNLAFSLQFILAQSNPKTIIDINNIIKIHFASDFLFCKAKGMFTDNKKLIALFPPSYSNEFNSVNYSMNQRCVK